MIALPEQIAGYAAVTALALTEFVWPTRCAVCEKPGQLLCDRCRTSLSYIDPWQACPRCGAPYGVVQCSECNRATLHHRGYRRFPLDGQASAVAFDEPSARIVRAWKDAGEQGLAETIGELTARAVPPAWLEASPIVAAIPASAAALRRRGFDHGTILATVVADHLGLSCESLLERPRTKDQRDLSSTQRAQNMQGRFHLSRQHLSNNHAPDTVLLVDDVCTTGATLFSAADALRRWGARSIFAVTFARVW